jgi:hypothetical protein
MIAGINVNRARVIDHASRQRITVTAFDAATFMIVWRAGMGIGAVRHGTCASLAKVAL